MHNIPVAVPGAAYTIHIAPGLLAQAGERIAPLLPAQRVVIIGDSNTMPRFAAALTESLSAHSIQCRSLTVPAGEESKSWQGYQSLCEQLLKLSVDRRTTLVALGGGVVGDLVGFAAATVLRGVPFVQLPTSLLAMVDSSVGGKTGINTASGKNLVGAFYQPLGVLIDPALLGSLSERHRRAGYAEILKYALLGDSGFFEWLTSHGAAIMAMQQPALSEAIATSCRAKAAIVAADEKEQGRRALLNLGHTFAHALEKESGMGEALHHGEAVAMGCLMAFALSVHLGHCPEEDYQRLRGHQAALGYPLNLPDMLGLPWKPQTLLAHMATDKKAAAGQKTFVLVRGIGKAFLDDSVRDEDVLTTLKKFC